MKQDIKTNENIIEKLEHIADDVLSNENFEDQKDKIESIINNILIVAENKKYFERLI